MKTLKSDDANGKDELDSFLLSLKSIKITSVVDTAIISATQRGVPQSAISLPAVLSDSFFMRCTQSSTD